MIFLKDRFTLCRRKDHRDQCKILFSFHSDKVTIPVTPALYFKKNKTGKLSIHFCFQFQYRTTLTLKSSCKVLNWPNSNPLWTKRLLKPVLSGKRVPWFPEYIKQICQKRSSLQACKWIFLLHAKCAFLKTFK